MIPLSAESPLVQVGMEDGERIIGWMKAEGLVPSSVEYEVLLKLMSADARWGTQTSQTRSIVPADYRVENPPTHAGWGEVGPCRSLKWRMVLLSMEADGGGCPAAKARVCAC